LIAGCGQAPSTSLDAASTADAGAPDSGSTANVLSLMTAPHDLAPGAWDYRCTWFAADAPPGAGVKSFKPITSTGVHHLALFWASGDTVQPEQSCMSFGRNWRLLAGAGVGSGEVDLPDGVAMPLRSGGAYVLQVHMLNATEHTISVSGGYDLGLTDPNASFTRAGVYVMGSTQFQIPAGAIGYAVDKTCNASDLPAGAALLNVFPHMHKLGVHVLIEHLGQTSTSPIIDSPWLFDAQGVTPISPPMPLAAQDRIHLRCTYDNTTGAPVSFGESTSDEMCFGVFYYSPATSDEIDCIR
jgi:hypothetical protein